MKGLVIPASASEDMKIINLDKHQLQTYYTVIGCRVIDIVTLGYNAKGHAIDAVIDDEGLLNQTPVNDRFVFAYLIKRITAPLFGNIIVVMTDEETGETTKFDYTSIKDCLIKNYCFVESDFPVYEN